jgi:hypothetical protein
LIVNIFLFMCWLFQAIKMAFLNLMTKTKLLLGIASLLRCLRYSLLYIFSIMWKVSFFSVHLLYLEVPLMMLYVCSQYVDMGSSIVLKRVMFATVRPCLLLGYLRGCEGINSYPGISPVGCLLVRVLRG